jgi:hypothetical protein
LWQVVPPAVPAPNEFYQDFRAGQAPVFPLSLTGTHENAVTRPEVGGFRITVPRDEGLAARIGLEMNTRLKGDFEITSAYEILQVGQPLQKHGVAYSIFVQTDTPRNDQVELARSTMVNRGEIYNCARVTMNDAGKRTYRHEYPPAGDTRGRLRLSRRGREVTLSAAEGLNGEFKELTRYDLGTEDVILISATGFTGHAPNAVDLRILDFRVRGLTAAEGAALDPSVPAPKSERPRGWLMPAGIIGLLILLTALALWLFQSRRRRAALLRLPLGHPEPAGPLIELKPGAIAPPLSFVCSGCGKALKVKAELGGRKVRCNGCGVVVLAPAPVQAARPDDPPLV